MKGTKKTVLFILTCLLIISSIGIFSCAKKDDKINIAGFEDSVEYAPLGNDYSVQKFLTAVDDKGNPYKGEATVTDGDGNNVELFADMFYVSLQSDYTVTVKVSLPDGKNLSRKITLKVIDNFAPVIKVETLAAMIAGRKMAVPEITVEKRIPEDITPIVKIVRKDGSSDVDIPIVNGEFIPDKGGNYEMTITATDQYGITSARKQNFFVFPENTIEDYSTKDALNNDKQHWEPGATKEILSEYEGKTGVIKKYLPQSTYRFTSLLGASYLQTLDPDYLTVTIWVDLDGEIEITCAGVSYGKIQGKKWQTFNITIEQILANKRYGSWEKFCTTHCNGAGGQFLFSLPEKATVYVDGVTVKEFVRPRVDMELNREIGDEIVLNATANVSGDYSVEYAVKGPDGKAVALSANDSFVADMTGDYVVTATLKHAEYRGESVFTINVTSPYEIKSAEDGEQIAGTPYALPAVKLYDKEGNLVSETYSVKAYYNDPDSNLQEAVVTDGKILFHKGDYVVIYSMPYNGKTYTFRKEYTINDVLPVAAGTAEDFADPTREKTVTEVGSSYGAYASPFYTKWLEQFNGRTGVVETITSNLGSSKYGQAKVGVRFNYTYAEMTRLTENLDYVSIWVYVDAPGYFTVSTHNNRFITEASQQLAGKTWHEIKLTKEDIEKTVKWNESFYMTQYAAFKGMECFNTVHSSDKGFGYASYLFGLGQQKDTDFYVQNGLSPTTQYKVYIDGISFVKKA